MKGKNIFWGIFLIVAAVAVIVNQLGYFTGITLLNLILTILLLPIIITSLVRLNFFGIFFPVAILGILFAGDLGIQNLVPWPILIVALLASIGFSIIFGKHKKYGHFVHHEGFAKDEKFKQIVDTEDDDTIDFGISFGSSIKYVNSQNLKKARFGCSFGALKIYLDTATPSPEGATIDLDVSFSGVEIYIPRDWKVVNGVEATLSGVSEKYNRYPHEGPTIKLTGKASFSGIEIVYV